MCVSGKNWPLGRNLLWILIDIHSSQANRAECALHLPSTYANANATNTTIISVVEDYLPGLLFQPTD